MFRYVRLFLMPICFFFCAGMAFSEPHNLALLKQEIRHWEQTGAYARELDRILTCANQYVLQQVTYNNRLQHSKKLALVLDIDETSLSNYSNIVQHDFGASRAQIHNSIVQANSPAISQTLKLYNMAKKFGVAVFFVTGRPMTEAKATAINLKRAGYHDWDGLYLRTKNDEGFSAIPYKVKMRQEITRKGYEIIANIGDQESDLAGGYAKKTFKLPNPFYFLP